MTRVFSIFERIGLGGGGKVKAVYHRMNALAEMEEFDPVLLNLDHSIRQMLNFAELKANGTIAPRVRNLTVPQACYDAAVAAGVERFSDFPAFDRFETKGKKTVYAQGGETVMVDTTTHTPIGAITKRVLPQTDGKTTYTLIDDEIHQSVTRNADGSTEKTDFTRSLPIRWVKTKDRKFIIGKNLVTDTICRMPRVYAQNIFEMVACEDAVVFFDGVTSAYLSAVTKGQRALFLHADHRSPSGTIVPRSRFLIENFKGEAIITSTAVHKARIETDVIPAAEIHVIPHFCDTANATPQERKHLVTVSRLELEGKPIHECIEAFCQIKDDFPHVDYLVYGVGAGQKQLEVQIEQLGCGDRVKLAGYSTEPLRIFRNAIASVYPTTTEGFGLSILEALSNGCPVISYDVNYGPREMIVSGKNGELVPRADIQAIAKAMRKVLSQPARYQQDTDTGLERYTRQAFLSNYRGFINKISKRLSAPE
ncbi:glycosyltransferase [Sulfitobacter sp. F26169L]|uniref:glycosyltransferase n=1 Tax=Sulfitobacter sp. F26169L TaxID=2996015 RepID=UPI002260D451|nr:glycosyltransferase [Sulfitobacter sp. F26169L]MCX7564725.1 glycosyltransferase [Sulfitobacter sp. F26169L]